MERKGLQKLQPMQKGVQVHAQLSSQLLPPCMLQKSCLDLTGLDPNSLLQLKDASRLHALRVPETLMKDILRMT